MTQGTSAADCKPPAPTVRLTASEPDVIRGATVGLSWTTQFASSCTAQDAWSGSKTLSGQSVTLNWSAKFATSCMASGGWSGERPVTGQETIGPISKNTLFTLTCTGPSGAYRAETLVTVTTTKLGKVVITKGVEKPSSGRFGSGAADGWLLLGLGALASAARRRRRDGPAGVRQINGDSHPVI